MYSILVTVAVKKEKKEAEVEGDSYKRVVGIVWMDSPLDGQLRFDDDGVLDTRSWSRVCRLADGGVRSAAICRPCQSRQLASTCLAPKPSHIRCAVV
jgi:hypothetical protein